MKLDDKGYRQNELPTGAEVNSIVKFYYSLTAEQYKHIKLMMDSDIKLHKKIIATLMALNVAIVAMAIKIVCHLK